MKIHNFIISSTRPELLAKQITSFLAISNGRRLNFYVFNDCGLKNKEFLIEIAKIKTNFPDSNIYYFNINKQIKIIHDISMRYSSILNVDSKLIVNCFTENGKLKGIRSIQNKSIFIFYLYNKDKKSIIHKIDDDIFPYEANRINDDIEIIIKHDFFEKKELSINENKKIISGSNYSIDSPSSLVHYADFSEFLFNFFKIAKNRSKIANISKDILNISPSKVRRVIDQDKLLSLSSVNENLNFEDALKSLKQHIAYFWGGISRVVINDNYVNRNGVNNFFPGGCVSFLYKNTPTLTPFFGNQDLLWELFEILDGKILLTDDYIGHNKTLSNRASILDDLSDSSYKHQTSVTYSSFEYLLKKNSNISIFNFYKHFIKPMNKWLLESKKYTTHTLKLLEDKKNWYSNENKYPVIIEIKDILIKFSDNYTSIKKNFSCSDTPVDKLIKDYYRRKYIFDKLLKKILN